MSSDPTPPDLPLDLGAVDAAVRTLLGDRWAATGQLDGVPVVAVVDPTDADLAAVQAVAPGAGLVAVPRSRDDLERVMDDLEAELVRSGELAVFLQMAPDGFSGAVEITVESEVPLLRAWAAENLPAGLLRIVVSPL